MVNQENETAQVAAYPGLLQTPTLCAVGRGTVGSARCARPRESASRTVAAEAGMALRRRLRAEVLVSPTDSRLTRAR